MAALLSKHNTAFLAYVLLLCMCRCDLVTDKRQGGQD